ncbi:tRNA (guanosine(37)-N1)-methyltransferase TrmD [bacterium]|uniref:tRNA (guanine-N(1)-)-methyltransferase n=2 Tax=Katanobacteria TaxID=422282 RepID=A0A2M7X1G4_UNCKA|nr:tRNA (guanosine(37)-N1)-methyltransferase TrmD [bacterium]PIP56656.1 MAG: tRNA (guanosine(37)-N1)-methyltransferase TrmD [candidate division WWE3 bacterium CG22_combo_CG10-13_8_21_14_all_39_12]PJA39997.1 MAG: tRNA (guanosine(37)-N1)-methyltransferase TrmD [candidate division WWE3 bacterium CG_4_9_14_3_um_filter_39_7]
MATPKQKPVTFSILTLFPKMFKGPFSESMLKRAQDDGKVIINIYNLRDWAEGKQKQVDDEPFGGGPGMVLKPEPIFKAVKDITESYTKIRGNAEDHTHVILLTPKGRTYNHRITEKLSGISHILLICGHYEGVDHRVFDHLAEERVSIGNYILTGGEIPAMIIVDSVTRQVNGVLGSEMSKEGESFSFTTKGLLKYPVYTRPDDYEGISVPEVLTSGNHKEIEQWRKDAAEELTKEYRPDLLDRKSGYF